MSSLRYDSAVVFVKDIETSKEFYTKFLQQKIKYDFGKNIQFENGLSIWQPGEDHEISANSINNKDVKSSGFELYFETQDIEAVVNEIEERGIKILHELKEEPWGQRTIRFFDPDGHLIEIGESMRTFVLRLKETMSDEEVSKKTGLAVNNVQILISSGF